MTNRDNKLNIVFFCLIITIILVVFLIFCAETAIELSSTIITAIATVAIAIFTWQQIKYVEQSSRPNVFGRLDRSYRGNHIIRFENAGVGTAFDGSATIINDNNSGQKGDHTFLRLYSHAPDDGFESFFQTYKPKKVIVKLEYWRYSLKDKNSNNKKYKWEDSFEI